MKICKENFHLHVETLREKKQIIFENQFDYTSAKNKQPVKCLVCGHKWNPVISSVVFLSGCPNCAGVVKLKVEDVDTLLLKRSVVRIDDFKNIRTKTKLRCLNCGYEWSTIIKSLIKNNNPSGCPDCSKCARLTNEIIDNRLKGRNIIRLEDCKNSKTKIKWQCLVDGYEWETTPDSILSGERGCKKCNSLDNDKIDRRLEGTDILRLGDYINVATKIKFKHLVCGHEYKVRPNDMFRKGSSPYCIKCSKRRLLTNEIVDEKLKNRTIIRVGECNGANHKTKFRCLICHHEYDTTVAHVLQGSGCPNCLNKNEKRIREYLKLKYGKENVKKLCLTFNDRKYHIDFVVNGVFIEYNGGQHYKPIEFFGGQKSFEKQQKRDQELRDYCLTNNIRLIEIPHWLSHEEQYKLLENLMSDNT